MRRELRVILVTLALAGLWVAGGRAAGVVAGMEAFRITDVEVHGVRHLDAEAVEELLAVEPDASVFSPAERWRERVLRHALVRDARAGRRLPGTLVIRVEERSPVALVPAPVLEPVDPEGRRLPIDPARAALDLPVLVPGEEVTPGARFLPARERALAAEAARLMAADTLVLERLSEIAWWDAATMVVRWSDPRADLLVPPGTSPGRLRDGLAALEHARAAPSDPGPVTVDLRFADQVVVRTPPTP